jgi:hypothetical protein
MGGLIMAIEDTSGLEARYAMKLSQRQKKVRKLLNLVEKMATILRL